MITGCHTRIICGECILIPEIERTSRVHGVQQRYLPKYMVAVTAAVVVWHCDRYKTPVFSTD